ncbi:MAG TPA: aminotransferase class I/II-fold pyridoxal phosphate-dependent enzyme, partial [Usitatibacteraceae bacterium]|nr:aminotransferase class I/II-fold pyridoxal phosphate-dependent enzyme [Usitatibacteraceae bacterium]
MSLSLIREEIRALSAYHVAPADGLIKLDAMENPHAFPEPLRAGLGEALAAASLNRYPPPGAEALKDALRHAFALEAGQPLLLGNGSDEIIQIVALALARPGARLLTLEPAFVMFRMIATFCGMEAVGVPLNADFSL